MEFIFLGTSAGAPSKHRNVSATAIKLADSKHWCLVDCGEGTQQQLIKTKLSPPKLSAIFITHVHGDHCYGLPGLLSTMAMMGRKDPLTILAPKAIEDWILATQKFTDAHQGFDINFIAVEDFQGSLELNDFTINTIELSHRVRSFAYAFTEKKRSAGLNADRLLEHNIPRGPLWGKIQQGEDLTLEDGRKIIAQDYWLNSERERKVIICGDNDQPELLRAAAVDADVLVHEATYTKDVAERVGSEPQHSYAELIASFAQSVGLRNLVLTHFSARYQPGNKYSPCMKDIEDEARAVYSGNLFLANDFDVYQLDKHSQLSKINEP